MARLSTSIPINVQPICLYLTYSLYGGFCAFAVEESVGETWGVIAGVGIEVADVSIWVGSSCIAGVASSEEGEVVGLAVVAGAVVSRVNGNERE